MVAQAAPADPLPRYRSGRLFARSASVCAVVCLAAGVAVVTLQGARLRSAWVAAADRSAVEFSDDLEALRTSCQRAAEIVEAGFGATVLPPVPASAFPEAIRSEHDLAAARAALEAYERYVADLKAGMLAGFSESAEWLIASLTRKAEKIRQQLEQEHSGEAAELQARIELLRRQLEGGGDGLYEALDQAERQRRLDILDQAVGFAQILGNLGGGDAVQARIGRAQEALARLRAAIPEPTPEGRRLRLVQQVADLRRALSDLLKDGHKLEGEELAGRLQAIRLEVASAMQSSWAADGHLRRLRARLDAEAVALAAVEQERARLLRWGMAKAGGLLLGALVLALLMRVLADVLTALFDVADALHAGLARPAAGPEPVTAPAPPDAPGVPGHRARRYLTDVQ